jgi:dUTPase
MCDQKVILGIKRFRAGAVMPVKATKGASGFDLSALIPDNDKERTEMYNDSIVMDDKGNFVLQILPGYRCIVKTGLNFRIPEGYEVQIRPRSGLAAKNRITAIKATQEIYEELDNESFKDFFILIKNTWNGVSSSLQDFHIRGMYEFFKKYNKKFSPDNYYDDKVFTDKLSKHSPEDIKKDIGSVKGNKAMKRFIEEIIYHYNYNQKKIKIVEC